MGKKAHRYCPPCDTYTHVRAGKVCKKCGGDFPPKVIETAKPQSRVYSPEEIEAAKAKKQCSCGAWTPGYASKFCHACKEPFAKRSLEKLDRPKAEVEVSEAIEVEDRFKPELEFKSEIWDYPPRYKFPSFMRKEDVTFCEYPCPVPLKYSGDFPQDHEVIEWGHEVRNKLINLRYVYPNNGCLFMYLRDQFKGKFAEQSDEMLYLRMLIYSLPDRKKKPKVVTAA